MRAPKARRAYGMIGGGSPLLRITHEQALALQDALGAQGQYKVYVGMSYWQPYIKDAVEQARAEGANALIAVSLYPQYSAATSGSAEHAFKEVMRRYPLKYTSTPPFYDNPLYIEALAGTVRRALEAAPGAEVLFSAHSLPESLVASGDPYVTQVISTVKAVAHALGVRWHLGYQSRSGPVKWLEPSTQDVIRRLAAEGVKDVVCVPVSFVSDHIETLYEVDILFKEMAEGLGMRLSRAESLNTDPKFIEVLKDMVVQSAGKLKW